MIFKTIVFLVLTVAIMTVSFGIVSDPSFMTETTMEQVNGGVEAARDFHIAHTIRNNVSLYAGVSIFLLALAFYGRNIVSFIKRTARQS